VFASGDLDSFEKVVRELLDDLRVNWEDLSALARSQSEQFEPATVAAQLREILVAASGARAA
jgi:hypothetical protein